MKCCKSLNGGDGDMPQQRVVVDHLHNSLTSSSMVDAAGEEIQLISERMECLRCDVMCTAVC